ncbi:hypothetical protein diail_3667 [Diaporthe ilicicola]|nr:hypothetical protein diail_3667 [Diaporthe ilicicola]
MASQYNTHPLPAPPGQQSDYSNQHVHYQQTPLQQTHSNTARPRPRSRGFSLQSDKSQKSDGKKEHLVESHTEKERQRLHSKADPTMAMNEAEPSAIAAHATNNLQSLRGLEHKDHAGNIITDPDLSNPTRWREERPLDTIRAFEAAIEGSYRNSMVNAGGDNESVMTFNPRNSYYGGGNNGRWQHDSYYSNSRPQSTFRPESGAPRDGYQDQYRWGPPDRRRGPPRMGPGPGPGPGPEQQFRNRQNGPNPYGAGNNQRSYETVASGSGTSAEPAGYQTDPTSSDNSSIERQQPRRQPEPINDYGIGFSQTPEYQTSSTFSVPNPGSAQYGYQNGGGPPSVPRKDGAVLRKPTTQESQQRPDTGEKRKSWFKRLSKGL